MNDNAVISIMETLGLNYNPAIAATIKFEKHIGNLNKELLEMKAIAMQSSKDISNSFSSQLGKMAGSKTIVDQFGNSLLEIKQDAEQAAVGQAKYNKELANLIQLRKTEQMDAQSFVISKR